MSKKCKTIDQCQKIMEYYNNSIFWESHKIFSNVVEYKIMFKNARITLRKCFIYVDKFNNQLQISLKQQ